MSLPRELTGHKVNPANDRLIVEALDGPGPGNASHVYRISLAPENEGDARGFIVTLPFQNGPINEVGVNGVTQETLLTILIDRLEGFQSGPYKSDHNERALAHLRGAQDALLTRTRERMVRQVEGTHAI
jgi:hypothetical protein